jgi:hypothetical protein
MGRTAVNPVSWISSIGKTMQLMCLTLGIALWIAHINHAHAIPHYFQQFEPLASSIYHSHLVSYSIAPENWRLASTQSRVYVGQFLSLMWIVIALYTLFGVPSLFTQSIAKVDAQSANVNHPFWCTMLERAYLPPLTYVRIPYQPEIWEKYHENGELIHFGILVCEDVGYNCFRIKSRFWLNYSIRLPTFVAIAWLVIFGGYDADGLLTRTFELIVALYFSQIVALLLVSYLVSASMTLIKGFVLWVRSR